MLYRKRGKSKRMRSRSEMKNKLPATFVLLYSRIQQTTKGRRREVGRRRQGRMRAEQRRCQRNFKRHLRPANMKLMAIILMSSLTQFPLEFTLRVLPCTSALLLSHSIQLSWHIKRSPQHVNDRREKKREKRLWAQGLGQGRKELR